jgi:hypothetical protein
VPKFGGFANYGFCHILPAILPWTPLLAKWQNVCGEMFCQQFAILPKPLTRQLKAFEVPGHPQITTH